LGERKLSQITRSDLFAFRDQVKSTPKQHGGEEVTDSYVRRIFAGLRRLFNFAVSWKLMEENPFPKTSKSGLFYPEQKGLRNFFTDEQMVKIVEASPDWSWPIILTAYYTGIRDGELRGLCWEWVDLNDGVIYLQSFRTLKNPSGLGQRAVIHAERVDWPIQKPT
jgi:integrase